MNKEINTKNSFILYHSYREHLSLLSPEQKGILLDAIFNYSEFETIPQLEPILMMAFNFIKEDIDQNQEKWEMRAKASRENGKLGGRPKNKPRKPKGYSDNLDKPRKPVSVSVNVSDSVSDNKYICSFEKFWNLYPKKVAKTKAESIYKKICTSTEKELEVTNGLQKYLDKWEKEQTDLQYIPNPTTWLNQRRWTDEIKTNGSSITKKFVEQNELSWEEKKRKEKEAYSKVRIIDNDGKMKSVKELLEEY